MKVLRGWRAETELSKVIRRMLHRARLVRGLHAFRRYVVHMRHRRIRTAFEGFVAHVKAKHRSRLQLIEAIEKITVWRYFKGWRELTQRQQAAASLFAHFSRILARQLFDPLRNFSRYSLAIREKEQRVRRFHDSRVLSESFPRWVRLWRVRTFMKGVCRHGRWGYSLNHAVFDNWKEALRLGARRRQAELHIKQRRQARCIRRWRHWVGVYRRGHHLMAVHSRYELGRRLVQWRAAFLNSRKVRACRASRALRELGRSFSHWREWQEQERRVACAVDFYEGYLPRLVFRAWVRRHQYKKRRRSEMQQLRRAYAETERRASVYDRQRMLEVWSAWASYLISRRAHHDTINMGREFQVHRCLTLALDLWIRKTAMAKSKRFLESARDTRMRSSFRRWHYKTRKSREVVHRLILSHTIRRWQWSTRRRVLMQQSMTSMAESRDNKLLRWSWAGWRQHYQDRFEASRTATTVIVRNSRVGLLRYGFRKWQRGVTLVKAHLVYKQNRRRVLARVLEAWMEARRRSRMMSSLVGYHALLALERSLHCWIDETLAQRALESCQTAKGTKALRRWRAWLHLRLVKGVKGERKGHMRHVIRRWKQVVVRRQRSHARWMINLQRALVMWRWIRTRRALRSWRQRVQRINTTRALLIRFRCKLLTKRALGRWQKAARQGSILKSRLLVGLDKRRRSLMQRVLFGWWLVACAHHGLQTAGES